MSAAAGTPGMTTAAAAAAAAAVTGAAILPLRGPGAAPAPAPTAAASPAVQVVGLTKRFGSFTALDDVSLRLERGSFHALLGENGAGKSTLVKCIMGYHPADSGQVIVDGVEARLRNPRDAAALGIGMVYQHFTLVDNMTVAENLALARRDERFFIDWAKEQRAVAAFMERMPFRLDPARPVRLLSAGGKQKLEILKQLYLGSSVLILDEPTSVLTPVEADEVLALLRSMTREGRLTVLMITHKFREVTRFADTVTVLRRGRFAGTGQVAELSADEMARMMVGAEPPRSSASRSARAPGARVLELRGLSADDDLGMPALAGLGFAVRAGEIVGIAGVSGNGQEELVEVLAGQRAARAGQIEVGGARYGASRAEMRRLGVRCLPEEPLRNACVPTMSVAENLGFRRFDRPPFAVAKALVSARALRRAARGLIGAFRIKTPSPDAAIGSLSGGNVQRAVLAREITEEVTLLVAANPCFGLDFAAVAEIRSRLIEARNRGAAVLLISADLDEVFALADRILVMFEGRIVHETEVAVADVAIIGRHMAGHHA